MAEIRSHVPVAPPAAKPRRSRLSAEDRRASIVDAATAVFAESGYQRGKMSEVAARLGVTEPVVFQNFGSKAALYAAVVEQVSQHMCAMVREDAQETGSAVGLLERILRPGHFDELHERGAVGVIFADAMSLSSEVAVQEAARRGIRQLAEALGEVLARGQAAGEVRRGVAPDAAAWWLLCLMASHGFRSAAMPDRERLEAQLGSMTMELLIGRADDGRTTSGA